MRNLNTCTLTGRLTRQPELKATTAGTSIMEFSLAFNTSKKNAQGEYEDVANYIDCTLFGTRAETLSQFMAKGMKVTVSGSLNQNRWEDSNGNKRSKHTLLIDTIELPDRNKQETADVQQATQQLDDTFDVGIPF